MSVIQKQQGSISQKQLMIPLGEQSRLINKQQLKDLILAYQNQDQKGYYSFKNWETLHQQVFAQATRLPQTVLNLWRVLKLINFGDDFIPTGLIYDTLVTLMLMATDIKTDNEKNKVIDEVQALLKSIFFKFIQFNGKYLSDDEKDQLAFFKVIRPVAEGYRKIIYSTIQDGQNQKNKQQTESSRNEQLYKMHNVFIYKKNLEKLKKIEEQFKECTFEPDLSYTSRASIITQSRYLQPSRASYKGFNNSSHLIADPQYVIPEQQYQEDKLFRATPIPNYPQVNPLGVGEHLVRMQKSREIRRINSLRMLSHLHNSNNSSSSNSNNKKQVKQFSIGQRDLQRKQRMVNSYKILFIIKVEVAKRIYSVKVRQNMGVTDVIRAIEMMVGFKHPQIQQIVKGYFINWEMKTNKKKYPNIRQFQYKQDYQ